MANATTVGHDVAAPLELFCVTLDWQPGDDEQGDYSASLWAVDEDEAILRLAEEMADSGEKSFDNDAERAEYIQCVVDGAGQYAAERVANRVLADLDDLLKERPGALKAVKAILTSSPGSALPAPAAGVNATDATASSGHGNVDLTNAAGEFKHMLELKTDEALSLELAQCGNGLLRYLMVELSAKEDCNSLADAVDRIEQTVNDLETLQIPLQDAREVED